MIGSCALGGATSQRAIAGKNLGGITITAGSFRNAFHVEGRISGNLTGDVNVGNLYRFDVDGIVQQSITAQQSTSAAFFAVNCNSTTADGGITRKNGDILYVRAAGDIVGPINAEDGNLLEVTTDGDLFGDVNATGDISNVDVLGQIKATIDAGGDLRGFLKASEFCCDNPLEKEFNVGGDLIADIDITTSFIVPVTIDGVFESGHTITLGNGLSNQGGPFWIKTAGGLKGQIIMNADNDPPVGGVWRQDIKVGPNGGGQIVLGGEQSGSTPYYSQTSSALGGGAVGLAPFHLHDAECSPVNGSVIYGILSWAVLSFYGPIEQTPSTNYPVMVEYSTNGSTWNNITSDFEFWTSGRDLFVSALSPEDFDADYYYRITPTNLRCVGVTGTPAVPAFTYTLVPN